MSDELFTEQINQLSQALQPLVLSSLEKLNDSLREQLLQLPSQQILAWLKAIALSDFVCEQLGRHPEFLLQSASWHSELPENVWQTELAKQLEPVTDEAQLMQTLRQLRNQNMLRIAWRDLNGFADLKQTLKDLTEFADVCIQFTLDRLYQWHCEKRGTPVDENGRPLSLLIIALGKLGGSELNFSSDIDLLFAYPSAGETLGKKPVMSNEKFFTELGQRFIHVLQTITADGFVFRVDMRLRPYGNSGPLAMSLTQLETYYQEQGRDWVRYALIKARLITGDAQPKQQLKTFLSAFVYRRYLDYSAIDSLRNLKQRIAREAKLKGLDNNVKRGAGGIREIEFICQAFQIIRGGKEPLFQKNNLLDVLQLLGERRCLPEAAVLELKNAYIFLRDCEHRLQMQHDRQTQELPLDEKDQLRLALAMGFQSWPAFYEKITEQMQTVAKHFQQMVAERKAKVDWLASENKVSQQIESVWLRQYRDNESIEHLASAGYQHPKEAYQLIKNITESFACRSLSRKARKRLDVIMPVILQTCTQTEEPLITLRRLVKLVEAIMRRSAYLTLLYERPETLLKLVELCAVSQWIADYLAQHPVLLDELLDAGKV